MRVGDLFSGIGGFSLAAEWMGWSTAFFSEIDPFASRVLAHHWPDVPNLGDITRIDWTHAPAVDVLTGGFPCQPHSLAGLRKGSADERDLFDEIIRAAGVLRPRYLVLENVPGLFTSDRGRFFGRVLGAVAALGYDAEWRVLSAADVGAPHKRERVWIVADRQGADGGGKQPAAYTTGNGRCGFAGGRARLGDAEREKESQLCRLLTDERRRDSDASGALVDATRGGRRARASVAVRWADGGSAGLGNADDTRSQGQRRSVGVDGSSGRDAERRHRAAPGAVVDWSDAVAVRGHDGTVRRIPHDAAKHGIESEVYLVAHGIPARVAQLRGLGNAIVPQCALEIFRAIEGRLAA